MSKIKKTTTKLRYKYKKAFIKSNFSLKENAN